ncbi:hypothetical protein V5799_000435 [Amblyomma americanum]|uniref:Cytochrome n=1 Tax=Amblyomma americanum TaxID=6943 RepID=A0AAQ4D321_AMBAM
MVILNDFQAIKKFLTKREVLYRPRNWLFRGEQYGGVATLNGEVWEHNRRFCLHVLRNLGFGKTSMEEHIKARRVPQHSGEAIRTGSLVEFVPPSLLKVVSKLPSTRQTAITTKLLDFIDDTKKQIDEHKATIDEHFNRDFIDGYLRTIEENKNDPGSYFQTRHLVGNLLSFFIAGSNTVAVTLQWHVLNFADKPDTVQARIRREIDEVVGRERQPAWEDRNKMPYTMACIWEMYRWKTVSPLGVPRSLQQASCRIHLKQSLYDFDHLPVFSAYLSDDSAGEDTFFGEHFIPKGTTVSPNVWAVHNDPTLWKEPSKFDPRRFLREDGSLIQPKPEYLIPFSIGKRMCPGEILASVEIFLYITCLLQKCIILPGEEKIQGLDSVDIPLAELNRYKVRVLPR